MPMFSDMELGNMNRKISKVINYTFLTAIMKSRVLKIVISKKSLLFYAMLINKMNIFHFS